MRIVSSCSSMSGRAYRSTRSRASARSGRSGRFEAQDGVAEGDLVAFVQLVGADPDAVDPGAVGGAEVDDAPSRCRAGGSRRGCGSRWGRRAGAWTRAAADGDHRLAQLEALAGGQQRATRRPSRPCPRACARRSGTTRRAGFSASSRCDRHRAHEHVALVAGVLPGGLGQLPLEAVGDLGELLVVDLGQLDGEVVGHQRCGPGRRPSGCRPSPAPGAGRARRGGGRTGRCARRCPRPCVPAVVRTP